MQLGSYMKNSKVGSLPYTTYESNSAWIKDSIIRAKTVKLLEEGMEEKMTGLAMILGYNTENRGNRETRH